MKGETQVFGMRSNYPYRHFIPNDISKDICISPRVPIIQGRDEKRSPMELGRGRKCPALITRESRTKYVIIRTTRRRDEKSRNDGDDGGGQPRVFKIAVHPISSLTVNAVQRRRPARAGPARGLVCMPREPYEDKKIVRYL